MSRRLMPIVSCLLFCLPACGLDVVEFDMVEEGQVGLAGVNIPGLSSFSSGLRDALSAEGVDPGDVDSMKVLSGTFEMTSQGGITKDLTFFEKLEFHLSATGMETRVLASTPAIEAGTKNIVLQVESNLELKPYLDAGDMQITVEATMNPVPPDRVDLKLVFRIRVDVNVV